MGKKRCSGLLVAALLFAGSGCTGLPHTGSPPPEPAKADELARMMPLPVKNRVHVLFVHGHDPLDLAGLADLRQHVIGLGFIKTYAGASFQTAALVDAAQEARRNEPEARFVLVGHGTGCGSLAGLATRLQGDGLPVDSVVCIAPGKATLPQDARVVAVVREGVPALAAAETHHVDAWPFHMPNHPRTQAILSAQLAACASQIAVVEERRYPILAGAGGEWDFLHGEPYRSGRCAPLRQARDMQPAGHE